MWEMLIPILAGGLGSLFGGGDKSSGVTMNPEQQKMLNAALSLQNQRMTAQNPLFDAVNNLAMALMPRSAYTAKTGYKPITGAVTQGQANRPNVGGDLGYLNERVPRTRANPTEEAMTALASGLQSPMNVYRDRMARGGR